MSLAKAKFGENKDLMTKAEALFKKCKTEGNEISARFQLDEKK